MLHTECVYERNVISSHISMPCSAGRGSFHALSAAGHAGGATCTPRRKCESRPGSVARVLGVQSRTIRKVVMGSISASPSLAGQWKAHNSMLFPLLLYHVCITPSLKLSTLWHPRYYSSRTSSSSFVTATDDASVCACLCHFFCRPPKEERTHNIERCN